MVTLYRHFDAAGALLYVGISASALFRLHQHKKNSDWFPQIATIKLEHFPDRAAALAAEKVAIQTEGPRYNYHWWTAAQKGSQPKPVKHCDGCGIELHRRRRWCPECARGRDREAQRNWQKAHLHKQREYGARFRKNARENPEVVKPLER